jgi:CBS domain-containing protein
MSVLTILSVKGRDVATLPANATLEEVTRLLASRKIGAVVICNDNQEIKGIISERDIIGAIAGDGAAALSKPVSEVMTSKVQCCREDDKIEKLMAMMTGGHFRHMPVERDGALIGIVSIGDVVKQRISEAELMAKAMRDYIATG